MKKKQLLCFARSGYYELFPHLASDKFDMYFVTINTKEKKQVEKHGGKVVGCFEEDYAGLPVASFGEDYLSSGFYPDRFLFPLTHQERRVVLGKMIAFWRGLVEKYNADACLHETISCESEEVVSMVCREYGCLDMNFSTAPVDGFFLWKPDPYSSALPQKWIDEAQPGEEEYQVAKEHIKNVKEKGKKPYYLDLVKDNRYARKTVKGILKLLVEHEWKKRKQPKKDKKGRFNDIVFNYNNLITSRKNFYESLLDDFYVSQGKYDRLEDYADCKKVLYPMHYEPEATLLYFAPDYAEQTAVLQGIAKNLPLDTVLVVKEHPSQPRVLLQKQFAELKRNNNNIVYIPGELDSHKLIKETDAIVTVTGSIGWEGLFLNKPVIVLGNVAYDKHPHVHRINRYQEIRDIINKPPALDRSDEANIEYLARVLCCSYKGYYFSEKMKTPENFKNFTQSIELCLERNLDPT